MACLGPWDNTHKSGAHPHAFFQQFFVMRIEELFHQTQFVHTLNGGARMHTHLSTANACAPGHKLECITASEY